MVSLLQDIIMGVNIGHDREWWTTPRSLSGGRMVLPLDFVADDLNGFIFYNHQEYECWKEGIARIAVGELRLGLSVNHIKELSEFKKILTLMYESDSRNYDNNLNNESYSSLHQQYTAKLKLAEDTLRAKVNSLSLHPNQDYTIKRINSFEEMQEFYTYTSYSSPWCLAYSEKKYDSFSSYGSNNIYVILHNDYKNINESATTQRCLSYLRDIVKEPSPPYDDYGLSMLLLVINQEGSLIYSTSRWNHSFKHSSHDYLNECEISKLTGRNFYELHIV